MKKLVLVVVVLATILCVSSCELPEFGTGSSGSGGSAGSPQGGSGGGTGGSAGSPQGGSAGSPQGGSAGSPQGGSGGSGDCEADQKHCGGQCVSKEDPAYGCAVGTCEPCAVENATAMCEQEVCVVDTCNQDYDDCDFDGLSCETDLNNDPDNCGSCGNICSPTVSAGECKGGKCSGPCGEIVQTGWSICYVLAHIAFPNDYVGLAGGVVPPGGDISQNYWKDPWTGCVSTDWTQEFVTCAQGSLAPGSYMQFRAGIHDEPTLGTIAGTWACNYTDCQGECLIYRDGEEVGRLKDGILSGLLEGIVHYQPPAFYDLKVAVP